MSKRAEGQNSIGLESPTTGDRQGRRVIARGKNERKAVAAACAEAVPCSTLERNKVEDENLAQGGRVEPARARARASKGTGRTKTRSKKSGSSPNGLGLLIHNSYKKNKRLHEVYLGLVDLLYIEVKYKEMLSKVSGKWLRLWDRKEKRVLTVPNGSRHNKLSKYYAKARKKILRQVKGFSNIKMLTLTFDPEKAELDIPLWWSLGEKNDPHSYLRTFLVVFGSKYIKKFLDRLKLWRLRSGQRWNYLAYVMEIQPGSGFVHYHLLFFGKWIAPIEDLKRFWDGSDQDAGVDISKGDNVKKAVSYVTKYVTKMNDLGHESKWGSLSMIMWYFNVRCYNTRHVNRYDEVKGNSVTQEDYLGIPRYQFILPKDFAEYEKAVGKGESADPMLADSDGGSVNDRA